MYINVHAGHNPQGKIASGAVGYIHESTENRIVKDYVITMLRTLGHKVYDCTEDNGANQSDILKKIVAKCNSHEVDLDISIHFNAGARSQKSDKKTTGTECLVYSFESRAASYARQITDEIAALGFKNRGIKEAKDLYVLKRTKAPAIIIECCFVDDIDDVRNYHAVAMAQAIVAGITGEKVTQPISSTRGYYKVQSGAFTKYENAKKRQEDLIKAGFEAIIIRDKI